MGGWIYVLELAPAARVKVGRTGNLSQRLTKHLTAAEFSGGEVIGVMSFAVSNPEAAEYQLLTRLGDHPDARLVHGNETFAGVTFMEVAKIASQVATSSRQPPAASDVASLVSRCASAMDEAGLSVVSLDQLRLLLNDVEILTNRDLGRVLRRAGVEPATLHLPREGRVAKGIKRTLLPAA